MPTSGTSRAKLVGDGDTFEVDGRKFKLSIERDDDMGPPWEEHDGHGEVSEWTTRAMEEGEAVLVTDGRSRRYYNVKASIALALKEWVGPEGITAEGTRQQRASKAVQQDFERLRAWCSDAWYWTYIRVTLLDGRDTGEFEGLGGVASDDEQYIDECAHDLARELLHRVVTEAKPYG